MDIGITIACKNLWGENEEYEEEVTEMMIKSNFSIDHDLSGNLILTIPKTFIQNSREQMLLSAIDRIIQSETEKTGIVANWNEDSARDLIGICNTDVADGSVHHDRDIYGLE